MLDQYVGSFKNIYIRFLSRLNIYSNAYSGIIPKSIITMVLGIKVYFTKLYGRHIIYK